MSEKITLDENDWEVLLKGRGVKIGNKLLTVVPFNILQLAKLKVMLRTAMKELADQGVTSKTFDTPEGMSVVFEYIASNCPALIEEACGLSREDVPKLPIATGITLMSEIINVNIDSQEGLMDALSFLGKLMTK